IDHGVHRNLNRLAAPCIRRRVVVDAEKVPQHPQGRHRPVEREARRRQMMDAVALKWRHMCKLHHMSYPVNRIYTTDVTRYFCAWPSRWISASNLSSRKGRYEP